MAKLLCSAVHHAILWLAGDMSTRNLSLMFPTWYHYIEVEKKKSTKSIRIIENIIAMPLIFESLLKTSLFC